MEMINSFKKYLVNAVPEIVIKYKSKAKVYETVETKRAGDRYITSVQETDVWVSYPKFRKETLIRAGFSDADAIRMSINKELIPVDLRDDVMNIERKFIIDEFVERNSYYRTINGLPPLDDYEDIYLDDEIYKFYEIDKVPLTKINPNMIVSMENMGILKSLYKKYPNYEFINYIGKRKVDIVTARLADNYSLLYFPDDNVSSTFRTDFINTYEECREYFLTCIYNENIINMYPEFDNFLAFCILTYTIQKMVVGLFKIMVNRDFYDLETTRIFLESYNVPFIKTFSQQQLKLLVKNLNLLLMSKSTNRCLFDILNLLGLSDFRLDKYYLMKQHKFNNDGLPFFKWKVETDLDGNEYVVEDKEAMYDLYFTSVDVREKDIQSALNSNLVKEDYFEFVYDDPRWVSEEAFAKLIEEDFNYIDTKYMDVSIILKIQEIMFEMTYISRMIVDKKKETSRIFVTMSKLSPKPISLFDMIVFLVCLVCKKNGMEASLLNTASKLIFVSGWNFDADLDAIKEEIRLRTDLDDELCKYIENVIFDTPDDINRMYENVRDFEKTITKLMNTTHSIKAYQSYEKLYNILMTLELNNSVYNLPNGETPETFDQYLEAYNRPLYDLYEATPEDNVSNIIDYVISKMSEMFPSTGHLHNINTPDTYLIDGILKLLRFFKSYTIDIKDVKLVYVFDSRHFNMIRLISDMQFNVSLFYDDNFKLIYSDLLNKIKTNESIKEYVNLVNILIFFATISISKRLNITDLIKSIDETIYPNGNLFLIFSDIVNGLSSIISEKDKICIKDKINLIKNDLSNNDYINLNEFINTLVNMNVSYHNLISKDIINKIKENVYSLEMVKLIEKVYFIMSTFWDDYIKFKDLTNFTLNIDIMNKLFDKYSDSALVDSNIESSDKLEIVDILVKNLDEKLTKIEDLPFISSFEFNNKIMLISSFIKKMKAFNISTEYTMDTLNLVNDNHFITTYDHEDYSSFEDVLRKMNVVLSKHDSIMLYNADYINDVKTNLKLRNSYIKTKDDGNLLVSVFISDVIKTKDMILQKIVKFICKHNISMIEKLSINIDNAEYLIDNIDIEDKVLSILTTLIKHRDLVKDKYFLDVLNTCIDKITSIYKDDMKLNNVITISDNLNCNKHLMTYSKFSLDPNDYIVIKEILLSFIDIKLQLERVIKNIDVTKIIKSYSSDILGISSQISYNPQIFHESYINLYLKPYSMDIIYNANDNIHFKEKLFRLDENGNMFLW